MDASKTVLPGSQAGSLVFCRNGYSYHRNVERILYDTVKITYLRCAKYYSQSCPGTCTIRQTERGTVWEDGQGHSCLRDPWLPVEKLARLEVLTACRQDLYESPVRLLNRITHRYPSEVSARIRLASFRNSMRRARMRLYPPVPHALPDLAAILEDPDWSHLTQTVDGSDNMYCGIVGQPGSQSMVFISRRMSDFLQEVNMVFCDATFVSTPALEDSTQLLQIVALVRNKVIPIVQAVMQSKSYEAYVGVLEHLQLVARFRPQKVMVDCEIAIMRAFSNVLGCTVVNCYVHFIRANLRKCGSLGLRQLLNNSAEARKIRDAFLSIPLLHKQLFWRAIVTLVRCARKVGRLNDLEPFIDYFVSTWMDRYHDTLSVFGEEHRTNNACESAHYVLRRETGLYHPSVWNFLNALRTHEQRAYVDVVAYRMGLPLHGGRQLSATRNDTAIMNFTRDLMSGTISVKRFLFRASHRIRNLIEEYQ